MDRRSYIKNILAASGGFVALPAWASNWNIVDLNYPNSSFSKTEQEILSAITETIIPFGNDIGARTVGVDLFLEKLFDRCYDKTVNANIKNQLASLNTKALVQYNAGFPACTQIQRESLLMEFAHSSAQEEKDFFILIKSETIRGFNTSELVMTKYLNYQVAPGYFHGCVEAS